MNENRSLDRRIFEMASRIKELREIMNFSTSYMAEQTNISEAAYIECESGKKDLNFAFIYRCAQTFGVDVTDIIEGVSPTLKSYTVTRRGEGQRIDEAHGMVYYNLAASFRNRIAEPLYVTCAYQEGAEESPLELTTHAGQEIDIVISGQLKVQIGAHSVILNAGDSIYYDSGTPHGMIAVGGVDCVFYAMVLNPTGEPIPELTPDVARKAPTPALPDKKERVYNKFVDIKLDENRTPTSIQYKNYEKFNFAYDVLDAIAKKEPNKLAMLHVSKDKTERRFTFDEIRRESCRCANYFKSMGIAKGDKVMLVLKRHYQFWIAMMALNRLGAIAIPATNQLLEKDFTYRFQKAGVCAILCTTDGDTANQVDLSAPKCPTLVHKIAVGGKRDGWRDFDEEYPLFSGKFDRTEDTACGDDLMLMYFTSGTSGYPKIAAHNFRYPLGHFHTAKYWHCVNPDGLHLTISDTGWAKAMWGKLYGQWLCEAAVFVYDFDRFDAADIMPMFAKYNITTFCAPPTMLRMFIKQDLSHYDLSSIQHMSTAGEALNPEVFRKFEENTGLQIMEGFGQSESTCVIANLRGASHKIGSMGKPVPAYDVHLVDADGKDVGVGESGEIVINIKDGTPCGLAVEYYGDPDKTADTWKDGFYHTGDVAWKDEDGYFWYVGRVDDVIKSSGYRIGPFEIESVIMELPYVLECGVSAAPDEIKGQVVKASIVLVAGKEGTDELKKEIQEYVKHRTAPYKYPRIIVFKDELPKTVSGKIRRNAL